MEPVHDEAIGPTADAPQQPKEAQTSFNCSECNKVFNSESMLKTHQYIHMGTQNSNQKQPKASETDGNGGEQPISKRSQVQRALSKTGQNDPRWNGRDRRPYFFFCPDLVGDEACTYATDLKTKIDAHLSKVHKIYAKSFWKKVGKDINVPESHPHYKNIINHNPAIKKAQQKARAIYPCTWDRCSKKFENKQELLNHIAVKHGEIPQSKLKITDIVVNLGCK